MKFPKLEITNFLAITDAEIKLADRGLVAIQGINSADTSADSNGAGKSSIADALCWAWFGTTARGATGDDIINDKAGKNCRVSSTVIDGALTYTVTRHRKHKKGKNGLSITMHDGLTETDLTKGTDKLTQKVADQIIGSSLEVFAGSIYAGQERMPDLPAMTDKALKMLIEEAAGVTILEDAYKQAREDMGAAEADMAHSQTALIRHRDKLDNLESSIKGFKINADTWDTDRTTRMTNAAAQLRGLIATVKTTDLAIAAYAPASLVNAIDLIDKKIASVTEENTTMVKLEREVTGASSSLGVAKVNIDNNNLEIAKYKHQLAHVDAKVGVVCGECGRPVTEAELTASRASVQKNLDRYEEMTPIKDLVFKTALEAHKDACVARDVFNASLTDVSAEQAQRAVLSAQHTAYEGEVSKRSVLMAQAKAGKGTIDAIKAETNPYTAQVETQTKDLGTVATQIEVAKVAFEAKEKAWMVEKEVVRVFSPAGVRARVLDEVTPFLNTQTSKYLSVLSDGNIEAAWSTLTPAAKKGEFKEKFSVDVVSSTGGKTFKLLSGGEKRKVRIATALALQDLVSTRASKPIDLFIGDEIDDALDPAGLERLMIILEEKAKERGSVFVISHNTLSDFIRQTLTIEKLPGGETRITELVA